MSSFRPLPEQPKLVIIIAGLILIVLLGGLDYVTGPQISFSVFYLLPISLVTWLTNRQGGIISATISAITWLTADLLTQADFSNPLIHYWNAFVRLLVFLAIVYLESALKDLNRNLEYKVIDRTSSLVTEVAERKKIEERLQQYAKRLEILYEIDQAILAAESLEAIAQAAIRQVENQLPCDRVSFVLFDYETHQAIVFDTSAENMGTNRLRIQIPILDSLRLADVLLNNDLSSDSLVLPILQPLQSRGYRSVLLVPIFFQNELMGSFNLMAYKPNTFSQEHLEIGREVANQLGIAINQARMVEQLQTDQENLLALSQRLLEVQEAERRNIARELHDEIGQALTGIGLILEMAAQSSTEAPANSLKQAHALVVELMGRVSRLSLELRPALLDDFGLLPALLWYLDRYSSQTNIKASLKHSGLENQRFAPEIETAAYRIIQEALTNVARHARVSETWVTLWYDQDILGIQVEDEGQGFDPDVVLATGSSSGLLGMRERALLLNGKLTIESAPGIGTRLLAELPVRGTSMKETQSDHDRSGG
jgi:signal transduction histidine kinase